MTASLITPERIQFLIEQTTPIFNDGTFKKGTATMILAEMPGYEKYLVSKDNLGSKSGRYHQLLYFASQIAPTLSKEQEQHLFRKYNYLKYQVQRLIERKYYTDANRLFLGPLSTVKNQLVAANLRLAVKFVKQYNKKFQENLLDISYDTLIRCVTIFNWTTGNRFSTYVTKALTTNLKRAYANLSVIPKFFPLDTESPYIQSELASDHWSQVYTQVKLLLGKLDARKRYVLSRRFGLIEPRLTQKELGAELGVSYKMISLLEEQALDYLIRTSRRKQNA